MSRGFATLFLATAFANSAGAHFVFLLPSSDGKSASAVFADVPARDDRIETSRIELPTVQVFAPSGKATDVPVERDVGGWRIPVEADAAEVRATVEYGVVNRGEGHLIRIRHHARMILGNPADGAPPQTLDIAPLKRSSGTAFRVTFAGKPVAGADVTVHEPGADGMTVLKTDPNGETPAFAKPGRYSARTNHVDKTAGEFDGRKYVVTHSYATLTVTVK